MPTKHVMKVFVSDSYYHVFNRGWNRTKLFLDEEDYQFFEHIIARHVSPEPAKDAKGREYVHLYADIRINAYCLMGNHFHLLVYQENEYALTALAKSVFGAYTSYFNKKYKRRGSLFESTYKAVRIDNDAQLMHITRYIHLNHASYKTWRHSSYGDYLSSSPRAFVDSRPILEVFSSPLQYREFVDDYESMQRERDEIKTHLSAES